MIVLSVATSGDPCSVAVCDDRGLIAERTFRHRMRLSERLMGDVESVLHDAGLELEAIDAFTVDLGPGSFTGVRIGVTAVKTWADLLRKPVAGVSALEATAYPWTGLHADSVVAMIRARPGAAYVEVFDGRDGKTLRPHASMGAEEIGQLANGWVGTSVTICGDGWEPFEENLRAGGRGAVVSMVPPKPLHASLFAEIARPRLFDGRADNAIDLVPLYIAPPPIGPSARAK